MGTALTGLEIKDTYDGLVKTTDNGPLSATAKFLSDGLGNDSILALSTSRVGIGTASPSVALEVDGAVKFSTSGAGGPDLSFGNIGGSTFINNIAAARNYYGAFEHVFTNTDNSIERVRIDSSGNVGIGTSAPLSLLDIENSNGSTISLGTAAAAGSVGSKKFTTLNFNGYNNATMAQIQSWDESGSTGFGYLTFSTYTGSALTEKVRILNSGGITFNGDTAAANALDDYEEGTWTIGVSFGGASVGIIYDAANGATYTKIGRQVTVNGYLILTSKGSSVGTARITGLPFTIGNANGNYSSPTLRLDKITFADQFQGFGGINTTTIDLEEITLSGTRTKLSDADFANDSSLIISFTYFV